MDLQLLPLELEYFLPVSQRGLVEGVVPSGGSFNDEVQPLNAICKPSRLID